MDEKKIDKQTLRLKRLAMAVATYVMATLALYIITKLGMGDLSPGIWIVIVALCLTGNLLFFILIFSGLNRLFKDPSLTLEQIMFSSLWGTVSLWHLPEARSVILMFFLPAFGFGMLRLNLRQYLTGVLWNMSLYAALLAAEFATSRSGFRLHYELFLYFLYGVILTWMAVFGGFVSKMRRKLRRNNLIIQKALAEVKALSGLLPICAGCKKIRDDKGYWNQIESYIRDHSEADFSHGICPDCARELYPDFVPDGIQNE